MLSYLSTTVIPAVEEDLDHQVLVLNKRNHGPRVIILATMPSNKLVQVEQAEQELAVAQQLDQRSTLVLQKAGNQYELLQQASQNAMQGVKALCTQQEQATRTAQQAREQLQAAIADCSFAMADDMVKWLTDRQQDWQEWQNRQRAQQLQQTELLKLQSSREQATNFVEIWQSRWRKLNAEAPIGQAKPEIDDSSLACCTELVEALTAPVTNLQGQQTQLTTDLTLLHQQCCEAEDAWSASLQTSPLADSDAFLQSLLPAGERQYLRSWLQQLMQVLECSTVIL
ncbi:hypothetical protein [Pseudogulbenkiania sp. NH8B]|uniref:hypothetical protein n=1 Tax=Pseudogulbenkiania sp. (strain NH8B) TaxID=748280 RepID=UPI0002DF7B4F|nr:hypothetical protein [Pseudogulbenkiania sp. NH8B]